MDRRRGYTLLVFLSFSLLVSCSLPVSLTIAFLVDSWASSSLFSPSPSLFPHNQPADRRTGAMMDDALSESDNIFSQSPKQDRAASDVGRRSGSFSVCEVQLLCSVTPLTTPISAARGLCKLELTTRPWLLKICTPAVPQRAGSA